MLSVGKDAPNLLCPDGGWTPVILKRVAGAWVNADADSGTIATSTGGAVTAGG